MQHFSPTDGIFVHRSPPKRERTMPITARFLNLILVITNVQSSTQICPANFIPLPASGTCPASRSCRVISGLYMNCCGSCLGVNGQCSAYTFGTTCSNTPISCPAPFESLPTDETGSRPSGSCPPWRPYQTTDGCCGACATNVGTVVGYDCGGNLCSSSPRSGCQSTKYGTSAPPPPPLISDEEAVGLAVGVIILMIIGAIILACVCIGACVYVCMRQRQASRGQPQFSNYVSNAQPSSSSNVPAVQIAMATPVYGADGKPAWQAS